MNAKQIGKSKKDDEANEIGREEEVAGDGLPATQASESALEIFQSAALPPLAATGMSEISGHERPSRAAISNLRGEQQSLNFIDAVALDLLAYRAVNDVDSDARKPIT